MDTNQKALAISALGWVDFAVKIRESGEWYATCNADIKRGSMLCSTMGNGATPEAAVDALWECLTKLGAGEYLVISAGGQARRAVLWNGFMWSEVHEKRDAA